MMNTLGEVRDFMNNSIAIKLRIIWKIFFGCLGILCVHEIFSNGGLGEEVQTEFIVSLIHKLGYKGDFEQMQTEFWFPYINWLPNFAFYLLTFFSLCSQFICFSFTKEGVHRGLKFGHRIVCSQKHFFEPWRYEGIQVDGILPFYRIYVYPKNPSGIPFFAYANFLDLIIFIDENVSCEKMNSDARENFRRLADKYRKLKKNHKILYWILNNL